MPAYEYTAVKNDGSEINGSIEGDSEKHIRIMLRERGLHPISIIGVKNNQNHSKKITFNRKKFSTTELALFTRQFATLIESGIPLTEALISIENQQKKRYQKNIILDIHSKIMEGYSLSDSFAEYPDSFPGIYIKTLAAGENSGNLGLVLKRLADYIESKNKLQQSIKNALIYPSALIITSVLVISFMLVYVVPKVIYIFENFDQDLPIITQAVIVISEFIRDQFIVITLLVLALIAGANIMLQKKEVKMWCHNLLLNIPIFGKLIMNSNSARYMQTLSTLSASGVPILDALKISAEVIINVPMRNTAIETVTRVSEGESISKSLSSKNLFPSMMIYMIASGEKSGKLEEMLDKATENQEEEFKNTIESLLGILQPLTVVIMAIIVLLIVLAILLPIFEINNLIA